MSDIYSHASKRVYWPQIHLLLQNHELLVGSVPENLLYSVLWRMYEDLLDCHDAHVLYMLIQMLQDESHQLQIDFGNLDRFPK